MKWEYFSPRLRNQTYNFSGLLSTGGALVFGASDGTMFAVDSSTGREVWRADLGGEIRAAPICIHGRRKPSHRRVGGTSAVSLRFIAFWRSQWNCFAAPVWLFCLSLTWIVSRPCAH